MNWRILVFYSEPETRDKIYYYPPIHVKTQSTFWLTVSMIYFDSGMSKSTNTVVYFDWKTVSYAANGKVSHIHRCMCERDYTRP